MDTTESCISRLASQILSETVLGYRDFRMAQAPLQIATVGYCPLVPSAPEVRLNDEQKVYASFFVPSHLTPEGRKVSGYLDEEKRAFTSLAVGRLVEFSRGVEKRAASHVDDAVKRALKAFLLMYPNDPSPVLVFHVDCRVDFIASGNPVDRRKMLTTYASISVIRAA